jgi:DnaJ-class molecular chaperone
VNYWLEALESSLDENGCFSALTKEQREAVAKDMNIAHEMHSEATGEINIPNPAHAEIKRLSDEVKRERDKVHCVECNGRGSITESCGTSHYAVSQCWRCHGEGRHDP